VAAYFVEWHPGAVAEHGAAFDLILGRWGEGASAADRVAVSLSFRWTDHTPGFMLIDAEGRHHAQGSLAAQAFPRSAMGRSPEVVQQAFAVADAIWLDDTRIAELTAPPA
jgi:hypothetical protein